MVRSHQAFPPGIELQRKFTSKMRLDIYFNRTIALINSVYGVNVPNRLDLVLFPPDNGDLRAYEVQRFVPTISNAIS
ncbi:hypothetical protein CCR75_006121 [Bremia lactucae]|uniref:Uncharacterized protein n=1 Tax=Bremia lactucae TaxID=4779 RepID=A0A976FJV5_BRELC|nr:hypothetical protein CCR75_009598 [Bremia lactucae]TDH73026.1 hypothetical protein CCR75_006119 [Bremia lactucae]TDH73518.1 hypothetical protein CCR75_006121 [Bremia lactucae]